VDFEYFLIPAMVVVVIVASAIAAYRRRKPKIDTNSTEYFRDRSQHLLECNKLDELITYARARIKQRPNQTNAHWYLGRALYLQKKWSEALASFNEVARLDPSWIEKSVTPHLRAIEARLQPKDMPVASDAPEQQRTLH
jgi:cytochrome c-type biogenesis protein CcmH/NrfG